MIICKMCGRPRTAPTEQIKIVCGCVDWELPPPSQKWNGIVEVKITDEMTVAAATKAAEMGRLNNSIMKGEGNIAGFLGEEIARVILGGRTSNTYDYDLVLDDGLTIDVKTKQTTVTPKDNYECSVAEFNTRQKCDYYCFVRVRDDFNVGWYLGVYPKNKYYKDATYLKKGTLDPSNNYVVRASCYNMRISDLYSSPSFKEHDV